MSNHKLFQLESDIGLLTLQIICFPNYFWIIITESNRLQIDGSLQVATKTPYNQADKATVINIARDEHQAQKEYEQLIKQICSQLGCFIVMSINTNNILSIADLRKISENIKHVCQSLMSECYPKKQFESTKNNLNQKQLKQLEQKTAKQISQLKV